MLGSNVTTFTYFTVPHSNTIHSHFELFLPFTLTSTIENDVQKVMYACISRSSGYTLSVKTVLICKLFYTVPTLRSPIFM